MFLHVLSSFNSVLQHLCETVYHRGTAEAPLANNSGTTGPVVTMTSQWRTWVIPGYTGSSRSEPGMN